MGIFMNNRQKGLMVCNEVKKILQGIGFDVEGPGFKSAFIPGHGAILVHKDYFDIYDLMIMGAHHIFGVQVTGDERKKKEKARAMSESGILGFVFFRLKGVPRGTPKFSVLLVRGDDIEKVSLATFIDKMLSEVKIKKEPVARPLGG